MSDGITYIIYNSEYCKSFDAPSQTSTSIFVFCFLQFTCMRDIISYRDWRDALFFLWFCGTKQKCCCFSVRLFHVHYSGGKINSNSLLFFIKNKIKFIIFIEMKRWKSETKTTICSKKMACSLDTHNFDHLLLFLFLKSFENSFQSIHYSRKMH